MRGGVEIFLAIAFCHPRAFLSHLGLKPLDGGKTTQLLDKTVCVLLISGGAGGASGIVQFAFLFCYNA